MHFNEQDLELIHYVLRYCEQSRQEPIMPWDKSQLKVVVPDHLIRRDENLPYKVAAYLRDQDPTLDPDVRTEKPGIPMPVMDQFGIMHYPADVSKQSLKKQVVVAIKGDAAIERFQATMQVIEAGYEEPAR